LDEADSDIRQVESTKTEEAKTLEGVREEKTRLEDVLRQKEEALAAAYVVEKGEERERRGGGKYEERDEGRETRSKDDRRRERHGPASSASSSTYRSHHFSCVCAVCMAVALPPSSCRLPSSFILILFPPPFFLPLPSFPGMKNRPRSKRSWRRQRRSVWIYPWSVTRP
jgi:hypothetical protein